MIGFTNHYDISSGDLTYIKTILPASGTDFYTIGNHIVLTTESGVFTKFDVNGNVLYQKKIFVDGYKTRLVAALECDNGDIMVLGTNPDNTGLVRCRHILLRIKSNGVLSWARRYQALNTKATIDLAKTGDTYVICGWNNYHATITTYDQLELWKINGLGAVSATKLIKVYTDSEVYTIQPYSGGYIMFGLKGDSPKSSFYTHVDGNLGHVKTKKINPDSDSMATRSAVLLSGSQFVIAGNWGATNQSFISKFDASGSSNDFKLFEGIASVADAVKCVVSDGTSYYVLNSNGTANSIVKFNSTTLAVDWTKELFPTSTDSPQHFAIRGSGSAMEFFICGYRVVSGHKVGLVMRFMSFTDPCNIQAKTNPTLSSQTKASSNEAVTTPSDTFSDLTLTSTISDFAPSGIVNFCCPNPLAPDASVKYQSKYVYLSGSGSDGTDGSVKGYHLRWDLQGSLGESHLPKGNLSVTPPYNTTIGFNRANDFVKIWKAKVTLSYKVTVNLATPPTSLVETGSTREWHYPGLVPSAALPLMTTEVVVLFQDVAQYNTIRLTVNPATQPILFLQKYGGILEVKAQGKLSFRAEVVHALQFPGQPSKLRAESLSVRDVNNLNTRWISNRAAVSGAGLLSPILGENIEFLRLDYFNAYPTSFSLETYYDFIQASDADCAWQFVKDFCLDHGDGDSNANVFKQLEDTAQFVIDNSWPKYNNTSVTGEFKVNKANYTSRWLTPVDGLKVGVKEYLLRSTTDPAAMITYTNSDPMVNLSSLDVSLLKMLNFVGLDFHVARMLGLGHIIPNPAGLTSDNWVFLMEYVTQASLDGAPAATVRHFFMSLPTSMLDERRPHAPELVSPPIYGILADTATGAPTLLTDPNGYSFYEDVRYINLKRGINPFEVGNETFFHTNFLFRTGEYSAPVGFGVEYRTDSAGVGNYVKPELSHDSTYLDPSGLKETLLIPNTGDPIVYTHAETQSGFHDYALYGVNWFSRPSALSAEVATDKTAFPVHMLLLPPSNFMVQLIQEEAPLMLTTTNEQAMLLGLPGPDKTMVRATFDWTHVHNHAYDIADKVQFFFRSAEPITVKGEIDTSPGSVVVNSIDHTVEVKTRPYTITSTVPPQVVQPEVTALDAPLFVGTVLVSGGLSFMVDAVTTTGLNPVIRLKQIRQTNSIDPDGDNIFTTTQNWLSPSAGDRFYMVQNLNDPASWDSRLVKEVAITQFSAYTETETYTDGTTKVFHYHGLSSTVTIEQIDDVPGGALNPSGMYKITFPVGLAAHPDPDVVYYKGVIRIPPFGGSVKKTLRVHYIVQTSPVLIVIAHDPDFGTSPIILGATPSITGVQVNFHPGYRVYLYRDTVGPNNFTETTILPALGEGTRVTYLAARSIDSTVVSGCHSVMTPPAGLLAMEIVDPLPPQTPTGPLFATRPDFYGKSTYTTDTRVEMYDGGDPREPYALVFYRASERSLLDALYKPATVQGIVSALAAIVPDPLASLRWSDLVNFQVEPGGPFVNRFLEHSGYRLPNPDNDATDIAFTGAVAPGAILAAVKDAIHGAFTALTEQPVVYSFLKMHPGYQTSGVKPKYRDGNGKLLAFTDPSFNPFPMAVVLPLTGGTTETVRFTDYTLDGGSRNVYFYFATELSNQMKFSDPSGICGPIQMVDTMPASQPEILSIASVPENRLLNSAARVVMAVNPYLPAENVTHFRLYRTSVFEDSVSVRMMGFVDEYPVGEDLVDTFADLALPPFSEPLYYRVVALRAIQNESGGPEFVPSEPSEVVLSSIADIYNPEPPVIAAAIGSTTSSPAQYHQVMLTWPETVYKGKYYLYQFTPEGQWKLIYDVVSSGSAMSYPPGGTFVPPYMATNLLEKEDADGNTLYQRFKVRVENRSGMMNLREEVLVV